ncbi:MAG TPA: Ig-like domain-containing protein, partial [Candidatus Anammoximicrobium sp.]|nr:Ig-like domain-containing protein [Candidatus Anammoximicrobium sp.]
MFSSFSRSGSKRTRTTSKSSDCKLRKRQRRGHGRQLFLESLEDRRLLAGTAPTATLISAPDVTAENTGDTSYAFAIRYTDADAGDLIRRNNIDTDDVTVTGPGIIGALVVTGVTTSSTVDADPIDATYHVTPPGGSWDASDNGIYTIGIVGNEVRDTTTPPAWVAANATFATFTVNVGDATAPTVTIEQAAGQADPTNVSPIEFTVVFSEAVTGFDASDIDFTGSTAAGTLAATVTGTGPTYTVSVSGMTGDGDVVASVIAGAATDAAGNANEASTSTDNTVTYDATAPTVTIEQAAGQADP